MTSSSSGRHRGQQHCPARCSTSPNRLLPLIAPTLPAATAVRSEPGSLTDDADAAARVAVVPASLAKGLESDAVVVLDPAAIVVAEPRGLHRP